MVWVNKYLNSIIGFQVIFLTGTVAASAGDFNFGSGGEGNAKCSLSGTVRPINDIDTKKGFQSMENHLRLSFAANDPQSCERYIKSYCQNNILGRGDVPLKLIGYFRPNREIASDADKKPTHTYELTENCKLIIN